MNHYTKLAVLGMRVFGLSIMLYSVPIMIWAFLRVGLGLMTPADGSALIGWMAYAIAGLAIFVLARPFGRFAARGLEDSIKTPTA